MTEATRKMLFPTLLTLNNDEYYAYYCASDLIKPSKIVYKIRVIIFKKEI